MGDYFGPSPGKIGDVSASGLKNDFATIPNQDVGVESDRIVPRQVTTGDLRGTQKIVNTDGSYITLGVVPESTDLAIAFFDEENHLISKSTGKTDYKYDISTGKNYYQAGLLPDGSYGVKIAESGQDVATATNDQLIFNSNYNLFKIVQSGSTTITIGSSSNDFIASTTVSHGLGVIPGYIAYVKPPSSYVGAPTTAQLPFFDYVLYDSLNPAATAGWHINGLADIADLTSTDITFRLSFVNNNASNVGTWTFTYFLLQQTIS